MKRSRFYVGVTSAKREVFASVETPNESTGYGAVIGPFRTKAGANFMATYGANNPHCRNVAEAEALARSLFPIETLP